MYKSVNYLLKNINFIFIYYYLSACTLELNLYYGEKGRINEKTFDVFDAYGHTKCSKPIGDK